MWYGLSRERLNRGSGRPTAPCKDRGNTYLTLFLVDSHLGYRMSTVSCWMFFPRRLIYCCFWIFPIPVLESNSKLGRKSVTKKQNHAISMIALAHLRDHFDSLTMSGQRVYISRAPLFSSRTLRIVNLLGIKPSLHAYTLTTDGMHKSTLHR
ncbi:hypothetical protein BKA63DRAFT_311740 [Paraphoma chrysanthemicola]|nr:hypothetical protein BKA63DRAFT_311740 [Paraphoma chrysanthemicola]